MICLESNHDFLSEWHSLVSGYIPKEHELLHKFVEGGVNIACVVDYKGKEVVFHAKLYEGAFLDVQSAREIAGRFIKAIRLQGGLGAALEGSHD